MRRLRQRALGAALAVVTALLLSARVQAGPGVEIPVAPSGRISDYAGVLDAADRAALDALLASYEKAAQQGAPQIAAVVIPSLRGDSVEDTALRFAERWKIGSKADDGVLLLVSVAEKKLRIEVGYGAESRLTDALASRVIRELIAPRLHSGDYAGGLRVGLVAIHQALLEQPVTGIDPRSAPAPGPKESSDGDPWPVGAVLLLFLLLFIGARKSRGGSFLAGMLLHSILFGGRRGGGGMGGGFSGGGGKFGGGGASGDY